MVPRRVYVFLDTIVECVFWIVSNTNKLVIFMKFFIIFPFFTVYLINLFVEIYNLFFIALVRIWKITYFDTKENYIALLRDPCFMY